MKRGASAGRGQVARMGASPIPIIHGRGRLLKGPIRGMVARVGLAVAWPLSSRRGGNAPLRELICD